MHTDQLGLDVSDLTGPPSCWGDSMANTSRRYHLQLILGEPVEINVLSQFVTERGYVRHPSPELPMDWRETDMVSDQMLPWYLAMRRGRADYWANQMRQRMADAGYRDGKRNLISPAFYAVLKESKFLLDIALAGQALIFKLPFRWSDSKHWFESSKNSTADYLNWFHASVYASKWVRDLIDSDVLFVKICSYYATEPGCDDLLVLYQLAIAKTYDT